jgi:hypothetical protein
MSDGGAWIRAFTLYGCGQYWPQEDAITRPIFKARISTDAQDLHGLGCRVFGRNGETKKRRCER